MIKNQPTHVIRAAKVMSEKWPAKVVSFTSYCTRTCVTGIQAVQYTVVTVQCTVYIVRRTLC